MEIIELLEKYLIPSSTAGEENVFYSKMYRPHTLPCSLTSLTGSTGAATITDT